MRRSTSSAIAGRDLESAGARADHRDALAAQVDRVVPLRGVERRAGEVLLPVDVGRWGRLSWPDRADHRARRQRRRRAVAVARAHGPRRGVVVPRRLGDLGLPPHVPADVVLVHDGLEVGLQLGLFGEEVRPLIGRLEAVAVEVIADVDPRAGVGVLVPRAADACVLLHDGERDAGLLEPDAGQQSGLAASDHDDREVVGRRLADRTALGVAAVELHLLEHHRHVLGRHRLADQPLHHLLQQLGADGLGFRAAAVAVVGDHLERDLADRGLVLLGHVALHLVEEQPCGLELAADQARVAGHVHQRQHQRRDADVEQRLGDLVVRRRKRLPCMWVTHHSVLSRRDRQSEHVSEIRDGGWPEPTLGDVGIATRVNGTPPPDVPLAEIDLGAWKFWVRTTTCGTARSPRCAARLRSRFTTAGDAGGRRADPATGR